MLAAVVVGLSTAWAGAVVVLVASGAVFADSVHRVLRRRVGGVLVLHLADTAVVGLAVIFSGLPAIIAIGPYGYILTGSVLLLPMRRAAIVGFSTAAWLSATLILGEPIGSSAAAEGVIWAATAIAMGVYLGATVYLTSIAAGAMQERGQLSESLRSSRARIHAIVESSPLAVFALDTFGRVTFDEADGLVAFGAPAGEVAGQSIYELVPHADELHLAVQEVLVAGETVARDIRIGESAFHVRLSPEFDLEGRVSGLIGIATDETERVTSSDALRRKVEMEQLISRLSTHLIGLQPDEIEDGVALALQSVAEFVGADRAVVALATADGRLHRVQAYEKPGIVPVPEQYHDHGPDDLPWLWNRLTSGRMLAVPNLEAIPREAWRLADVWRSIGVNSVAVVPIFLFREFAGAASIDSMRVDAFSDDDLVLLRFMAEMAVAVLHRKRVHVQLEDLVKSKDQFIASVSHELRTPLTTVVGLADELKSRPGDFSEAEQREFHRLLAEQAAEVSDIVEDLLVVARADIGKVSIQASEVDIPDEVEGVLRGFVDGDRVVTIVPDDVVLAWGDRTRLRQVIRNMVSNALRYGGTHVELRVRDEGDLVAVEVADDGGTLSPETAEELFEPYRHTAQVEGRPPSIGLGLTVGRKLARLMGGDLRFVPTDDWTVFRLELPTASPPRAEGFDAASDSASVGSARDAVDLESVIVESEERTTSVEAPAARSRDLESAVRADDRSRTTDDRRLKTDD
jgi:signal transduction histidine kinase/PAS domain-containing protein